MRHLGSFNPASGVGGAGVHWNGQNWRFLPTDFQHAQRTPKQRYGKNFIPADMTIQDWGVTYEELEPYYDKFEYLCGISGQAGNVQGKIQPGGNPFEGPRARAAIRCRRSSAATPPCCSTRRRRKSAQAVSLRGREHVAAVQEPLRRADGPVHVLRLLRMVRLRQLLEVFARRRRSFRCCSRRTTSPIARTATSPASISIRTGKRATGVTYVDVQGREFEQPAELVILCAFAQHNVHLLLLSGIGKPYDPKTNQGVIGRNYAYQITSSVNVFLDEIMNPFMGAGALGQAVDEFNGDNFDHGPAGFIGGGYIALWTTGGRPILQQHGCPKDTPKWGSGWKKAMARELSEERVASRRTAA